MQPERSLFGRWERAEPRVYRVAGSVRSWRQRLLALVLSAGPEAGAFRQSAAALWRIPGFPPGTVEVGRPRGRSARADQRIHHSRYFPPHHLTVVEGIPVTVPARTIADICALGPAQRAERALDNALAMDLTTIPKLEVMLAEFGERGREGTALLRQFLDVRDNEYVPPMSELEALLLAVIAAAALPPPTKQLSVGGTTAPAGRVDFVYRQAKFVIEADSKRHHSSWLDVVADRRRDALLTAAGWQILRVTWHQLIHEPELVVAAVRAVLRRAAA